jgi:hypothetical protein
MTSKRRILLRIVFWLVSGVVLAAAGFVFWLALFFDSNSMKPRVAQWAMDAYGRKLEIGDLHWTPFLPSRIIANKVMLEEPAGKQQQGRPLVAANSLRLDVSLSALLADRLDVRSIELTGARLRLARTAEGRWNFDDLLPRGPSRFKSTSIDRISLVDSAVEVLATEAGEPLELTKANFVFGPIAPGRPAALQLKSAWRVGNLTGALEGAASMQLPAGDSGFTAGDVSAKASVDLPDGRRLAANATLRALSVAGGIAEGFNAHLALDRGSEEIASARMNIAKLPFALDNVPVSVDWRGGKWSGKAALFAKRLADASWKLETVTLDGIHLEQGLSLSLRGAAHVDPIARSVEADFSDAAFKAARKTRKPPALAGRLKVTARAAGPLEAAADFAGKLAESNVKATVRYPVRGQLGFAASLDRLNLDDWREEAPTRGQRKAIELDLNPLRELAVNGTLTVGTLTSGTTVARNVRIEVE